MIKPRETVILASDPRSLVDWYCETLGFEIKQQFTDDYTYFYLEHASGIRIGVASASEMGVKSPNRPQNTVILQIEVPEVAAFFTRVTDQGGAVTFGPNHDAKNDFWFGGVADPEGNPIWVVDPNCP